MIHESSRVEAREHALFTLPDATGEGDCFVAPEYLQFLPPSATSVLNQHP